MSKATRVLLVVAAVAALAVGIWRDRHNERRMDFAINNLTNYIAFSDSRQASNEIATVALTKLVLWQGQALETRVDWLQYGMRMMQVTMGNHPMNSADIAELRAHLRRLPDGELKTFQGDLLDGMEKQIVGH